MAAGFVSGSADHELKFWEWQLVSGDAEAAGGSAAGAAARRLTVRHTRTLKMTDDVLCVRISPNGASLMLGFVGKQSVASLFVCSVKSSWRERCACAFMAFSHRLSTGRGTDKPARVTTTYKISADGL